MTQKEEKFRARHNCDDKPDPKMEGKILELLSERAGAKVDN